MIMVQYISAYNVYRVGISLQIKLGYMRLDSGPCLYRNLLCGVYIVVRAGASAE